MLELSITAQVGKRFVSHLRRYIQRAHAVLKPALAELSLAIVNDAKMRALHNRFMQIDSPTDVLTFELEHGAGGKCTSGEVVICLPEAQRQAKMHGVEVKSELLLYALHGVLHLCGFDDRTDREYRRMHRAEDRILRQLGVGPVFRPSRPAGIRHRGIS